MDVDALASLVSPIHCLLQKTGSIFLDVMIFHDLIDICWSSYTPGNEPVIKVANFALQLSLR